MGQKKLGYGLLVSGMALTAVACGGGGGSAAAGFTSGAALTSAMASPTGTVEAATAVGVAQAFQASAEADPPAGIRQKVQAQSATQACPGGGSISATSSNNGMDITGQYNNCSMEGCVVNGSIGIFTGASATNACYSYDIDMTCTDQSLSASMAFSGCIDSEFGFVYLVEYEGASYKVTGSYSNGSGTLSITGENGSWDCTYTADAGSCTGTGGSFEFTPDSAAADDTEG